MKNIQSDKYGEIINGMNVTEFKDSLNKLTPSELKNIKIIVYDYKNAHELIPIKDVDFHDNTFFLNINPNKGY